MSDALTPVLLGYGVGSLPIGFVLANLLTGLDLRRVGSGNVGAANVYRTTGLAVALVVVLLDIAKGAGSVMLASRVTPGTAAPVAAGVAAILGHVYPVWLRFQGGKGVATACGVFMLLAPIATAIAASAFVLTIWVTRYVSMGSVVAAAALPPLAWITGAPLSVVAGGVVAALLILRRHTANIARVAAGTEHRIGQRI